MPSEERWARDGPSRRPRRSGAEFKQNPYGGGLLLSRFPGEGGLDFQEEVLRVPESIGHALDYLDAVVNIGRWYACGSEHWMPRAYLRRLRAKRCSGARSLSRACRSRFASVANPLVRWGVPNILQRIEHIDRSQRLVGSSSCNCTACPSFRLSRVAQQQPTSRP